MTTTDSIQVLSERDHVLTRHDMYLGSVLPEDITDHVVDHEGRLQEPTTVRVSPALLKVVDEIIVNAADRRVKALESPDLVKAPCDTLRVDITDEGSIRVWNNGDGVEVRKHESGEWVPSVIFGQLRSGSNFNDEMKRITGGRNGLGAKLTNIFSKKFVVETVDAERKLLFRQEWRDNMSICGDPTITKASKKKAYTCIEFWPDLPRFGMQELTEEVKSLLRKRVFEIAATGPSGSKVYLNGRKVPVDGFQKYTKLFLGDGHKLVFEQPNDRWKVGVVFMPNEGFRSVSFVNSIGTSKGGTHVEHVLEPVVKSIQAAVAKKFADHRPTPAMIKDHLGVFVDCLVENPSFDAQTKNELKTKPKDFGSACKPSKEFYEKILKTGIVKHVGDIISGKAKADLMKGTDGRKTAHIKIPKLEDAEWAGTGKSEQCILILTEGDSAKASAVAGVSSLPPNLKKAFGIFPLRGKLLNVRDASVAKLEGNQEIANIKKILGLQQGKSYRDRKELRYGKIMIMTDQDVDGAHIKGLILNLVHQYWPDLLDGFICCLATPIVKAFPKQGKGGQVLDFYSQADYEAWKAVNDCSKYRLKYYKGLGTSTREESKQYFKDVFEKLIHFHNQDKGADVSIPLAFDKSKADDRKAWLLDYDPERTIPPAQKQVSITDFIQSELIHFSADDVRRSIPSLVDGFTPSRRKVIWTAIKKGLWSQNKEVRVSQLAGAVSELSNYHHGEASLQQTIVRLAQNYVGSNNINLLVPSGQFGTRMEGGADAASPRYIMTYLDRITSLLLREEDEGILSYVQDDGVTVEPESYLPVIPLVLVNGCEGIGTGWSTFVPPHNPRDIIASLRRRLQGSPGEDTMVPWYKGFKGSVVSCGQGSFDVKGVWELVSDKVLHITELPVGTWTTTYKDKTLDPLVQNKTVEKYGEQLSDLAVDFKVHFRGALPEALEKTLKLVDRIHTGNMHLFPPGEPHVRKYVSASEILDVFFGFRLAKYGERKLHLLKVKAFERGLLYYRVRFIEQKMDGTIELEKRAYDEVIKDLQSLEYPPFGSSFDDPNVSYRYLTGMSVFQFTSDRRAQLQAELQQKVQEYEELERTTPQQMWLADLEELEAAI